MSAGWVAGSVRAKALTHRRLGAAGARGLAARPTLAAAVQALSQTPYGHDVTPGQGLAAAQHAAGATVVWNARVLAGWLPRQGAELVRLLTAGFELANIDTHLARLTVGGRAPVAPTYVLGTLSTAWTRVTDTTTLSAAADVLAASPWQVRGTRSRRELALGLRLAWADAVVGGAPAAAGWARAGAVLLLAQEVHLEGRRPVAMLLQRARQVLGAGPADALAGAASLPELRTALPGDTRWVLADVDAPVDLWRAETQWWHRVESDGFALLREAQPGPRPVCGALAVLAADLRRVRAALEVAARGGAGPALEVFDAVA